MERDNFKLPVIAYRISPEYIKPACCMETKKCCEKMTWATIEFFPPVNYYDFFFTQIVDDVQVTAILTIHLHLHGNMKVS
jgi:hypothetical protein